MRDITVQSFITQWLQGMAEVDGDVSRDVVETFGVTSGVNVPYRFHLRLRKPDGLTYEVYIKE